jgi:hypothetical protein
LHFNDYEVQLEQNIVSGEGMLVISITELNQQVWMGSAMSIDEPTLPGRTPVKDLQLS